MKVEYEIKGFVSDYVKNNITSKISNIYSATIKSINPFKIEVEKSYANKVVEILERENVKYEKK
jgi:hypothetical protein